METFKSAYEMAVRNNRVEKFRGDEISKRIAVKYPLSAQIALLMDKDLKYDEWIEYQTFRAKVKSEVDVLIANLEVGYRENHGA